MDDLVSTLGNMIESTVLFEDMEGVIVSRHCVSEVAPDSSRAAIIKQGRLSDLERLDRAMKTMYLDEGEGAMRRILPVKNLRELYGYLTVIVPDPKTYWRHEVICQNAALHAALIMSDKDRQRHSMLRNTLNASEAERVRIAHDLQDQTSQNLVAMKVLLFCVQTAAEKNPEDVPGLLEDVNRVADDILTSVNHTAAELRPNELDYLGLGVAIDTYAARKLQNTGCTFELEGNALDIRFDPLTELTLLKVAQEAIRNVAKHSGATHCVVSVDEKQGYLTLVIWDNGDGFDLSGVNLDSVSHKRYGLKTMKDKVEMLMGSFWIGSEPSIGTKVIARVPLPSSN
jgi:signal transduction histidine kinase